MTIDYDFQQVIGTSRQVLIYFKIQSETREGCKSYKKLTGVDLDSNKYVGLGIVDERDTIKAINVRLIDVSTGEEIYLLNDDGSIILTDVGGKIET